MPESPQSPAERPQTAPSSSTDQPSAFEPAFRAVQVLFQTRLREARDKIDPLSDSHDRLNQKVLAAITEHSRRMKGLTVAAGLMRPTGGELLDRSGLLECMERLGKPEARAVATYLRLDELWKKRDLPVRDKPDELDEQTYWEADKQILSQDGLFEPEARRHMLAEHEEIRELSRKADIMSLRTSTEMRRMILFSSRERDFNELDELFKKRKYYLATQAAAPEASGKKDRRGSSPHGSAIRLAESSGRIMELLAEMGAVRAGPEEFKKEATRRMCADVEEVISQMDAIISESAALK
jgi:hypothetical protein